MSLIEINDATYTYPTANCPSIKNLSLKIEEGKFYTIVGKNGSGKSTLCNMIRGFIPNFYKGKLKGEIIFDGKNIEEYSTGELALKIGYIFQNPFNQITGIKDTVFEEVAYGLENFGVEKKEIIRRVNDVMELTDITHLRNANPFGLSGGQQQKVALASIIILNPDVLVIDEPTSQLDPHGTEQVFKIIKKLKEEKKTIILAEHKMDLIIEYTDEVIILDDGKLLNSGDVNSLLSNIDLHNHGCLIPQTGILMAALEKNGINIENKSIKFNDMLNSISKVLKKEEN